MDGSFVGEADEQRSTLFNLTMFSGVSRRNAFRIECASVQSKEALWLRLRDEIFL